MSQEADSAMVRSFAWLMIAAALMLRLPAITRPPMEFHPTRQYHGAKIIRSFYYAMGGQATAEQKKVVAEDTPAFIEPPVLELISAAGWRIAGHEMLWLPRLLSVIAWCVGGIALFALARSFLSPAGALFALGFYLFAPYGVIASRSIQPDPLMISLMLFALWACVAYARKPSRKRFFTAVALTAAAVFIKPVMAAFVICSVFALLRMKWEGLRSSLASPANWVFPVLAVLPAVIYFGVRLASGAMEGQMEAKFMPQLWRSGEYWAGWMRNADFVVGLGILFAAVFGVLIMRSGEGRAFGVGYFIGYVLFGLVFSYHIFTHDYYHLQLLPIVGIGLGVWAELFAERLKALKSASVYLLVLAVCVAGFAVLCLKPIRWHYAHPGYEKQAALGREIGEKVSHGRVVLLAPDYGKDLTYYGVFAGQSWPRQPDLRMDKLMGKPAMTVKDRIRQLIDDSGRYFVVTDFDELKTQPELQEFLNSRPLVAKTESYTIYDVTPGTLE